MPKQILHATAAVLCLCVLPGFRDEPKSETKAPGLRPGSRVLLDAHNCYPYDGKYADRIERALATGMPLAIEQDLVWYTDSMSGKSWSVISHGKPLSGNEPTMKVYFFERIRPLVERALREGKTEHWPLLTLDLDFKSEEPGHLAAVWDLLGEYEDWLCTAERGRDVRKVSPIRLRPLLVLTGDSEAQQRAFHDTVPVKRPLRLFGSYKLTRPTTSLDLGIPAANNYRRWWNNSWAVVEEEGQPKAGAWSETDAERLKSLVRFAHGRGLWIRFYTLNGHLPERSLGWSESYNFGSEAQVEIRWRAAIEAGVDFVATDQYEAFASLRAKIGRPHRATPAMPPVN
jgi:hypothetical protein